MHLGRVGAVAAQPGAIGVPEPVRPQVGDPGVLADREHHLGDSGDRQGPALPGPQRPVLLPRSAR
ncbi:hypothetical protein GCM10023178_39580 [Actinomadura luteofluorescens]